jgi:hypothetical protein
MSESAADSDFELPQLYKHHAFACFTQRPPGHPRGSCGAAGAQPLWERMSKAIETQGLGDIGFTASGCLGFCNAGPLMVVYPEISKRSSNPISSRASGWIVSP